MSGQDTPIREITGKIRRSKQCKIHAVDGSQIF